MGFLDALIGRTKAVQPDLNRLFSLPGATVGLQAAEGLVPSLRAGVCFKTIDDPSFASARTEITELLALNDGGSAPADLTETTDSFGYSWMVIRAEDFDTLVTRVHYVNSTLSDHGYGPQLLCSVVGFGLAAADQPVSATTYLVYLYKQGTFYPFVPLTGQRRNNEVELRLMNELAKELPMERQLDRWFPMWDMPL